MIAGARTRDIGPLAEHRPGLAATGAALNAARVDPTPRRIAGRGRQSRKVTVMDNTKPEVHFPEASPPSELEVTDLTTGDGDEATAGKVVQVHYVGVAYSSGEEFDSSWDRGRPLAFPLGAQRVISGWDQGIQGMRVGGRRRLVIPPHLAYGDRGAGGVIKPGETLIFVCDLVAVQ